MADQLWVMTRIREEEYVCSCTSSDPQAQGRVVQDMLRSQMSHHAARQLMPTIINPQCIRFSLSVPVICKNTKKSSVLTDSHNTLVA